MITKFRSEIDYHIFIGPQVDNTIGNLIVFKDGTVATYGFLYTECRGYWSSDI